MSDETQAPPMIWLQDGGDYAVAVQSNEVTWCADQIDDTDTEYVRHDRPALLASPIVQEIVREAVDATLTAVEDAIAANRIRKGEE